MLVIAAEILYAAHCRLKEKGVSPSDYGLAMLEHRLSLTEELIHAFENKDGSALRELATQVEGNFKEPKLDVLRFHLAEIGTKLEKKPVSLDGLRRCLKSEYRFNAEAVSESTFRRAAADVGIRIEGTNKGGRPRKDKPLSRKGEFSRSMV
jgi:hypothetical protein